MKHLHTILICALATLGLMTSCKKEEDTIKTRDSKHVTIMERYINSTVSPTYSNLASYTEQLADQLATLKAEPTQANLDQAAATFLTAREWWEKSEAFLFGAATDFGIDPHIDSWPLDEDAFNTLMSSPSMIAMLDAEDGDVVAGERLGNSLLGFHGIEYILFANGQNKDVTTLTNNDLIYAVAVAGDLRNRCYQLEVSWLGSNAPKSHQDAVEELELNCTVNGGSSSYGTNLVTAGSLGSTYASSVHGLMAIVDGCKTIADEVGTSKIGKPYNGEDPDYIESPYSHKSIIDFYNNIVSIENAYFGGIEEDRNTMESLHNYVAGLDADLANRVAAAIENAKTKIMAMPAPFVDNYTNALNAEAIAACQALDEVLSEVNTTLEQAAKTEEE